MVVAAALGVWITLPTAIALGRSVNIARLAKGFARSVGGIGEIAPGSIDCTLVFACLVELINESSLERGVQLEF